MKKLFICSVVALTGAGSAFAQKIIEGHLGRKNYDVAYATAATTDGGYIATGLTQSGVDTVGDIIILKTDAHGDTMWTKVYGGPKLEGGNAIMQTADGGYLVSGHTQDYGAEDCDAFMLKLDKDGNYLWIKVYGGEKDDIAEQVTELADGSFVMAAITESYGNTDSSDRRHAWFIKTNSTGSVIWKKCYAGIRAEYAYSILPVASGGYLADGWTMSRGNGEHAGWLLRLNENGDTTWTRLYPNGADTRFYKLLPANDGGFMLAGFTTSASTGKMQGLMVKLDADGAEMWKKTYGTGNQSYVFHDVAQTPDGNYLFTGADYSKDTTGNIVVLKTNASGVAIGGDKYDATGAFGNAIAVQGNNSYLVAGITSKYESYGDFYYIEKDNTILGVQSVDIPSPLVYPNPVQDRSIVILPASHANQSVNFQIVTTDGKIVVSKDHIMAKDIVINRANLPAGQYVFRVTCMDGKVFKGKLAVE